jgi:hemoglobin-like flavoprotein
MTPEQVALVIQSVDALRPRMPEVAADFYRRLFEIAPQVRELFQQDLTTQTVKFARELDEIVAVIPAFSEFEGRTAALGRRHAGYGVRASHYELVRQALMAALGNALGVAFDEKTREAWVNAFGLVAESMQLGAAAAHRGTTRSE